MASSICFLRPNGGNILQRMSGSSIPYQNKRFFQHSKQAQQFQSDCGTISMYYYTLLYVKSQVIWFILCQDSLTAPQRRRRMWHSSAPIHFPVMKSRWKAAHPKLQQQSNYDTSWLKQAQQISPPYICLIFLMENLEGRDSFFLISGESPECDMSYKMSKNRGRSYSLKITDLINWYLLPDCLFRQCHGDRLV